MRKFILTIAFILGFGLSVQALSYNEARQRAWFLTDKMAYELNLSPEQYDLVYEINFDYFLRLRNRHDITGVYWNYRQADLQTVLLDWQYSLLRDISYFMYPISWTASSWYYPVYTRYSASQYYFDRPNIYITYRGYSTPQGHNHLSRYSNYNLAYNRGMRDMYYNADGRRIDSGRQRYTPQPYDRSVQRNEDMYSINRNTRPSQGSNNNRNQHNRTNGPTMSVPHFRSSGSNTNTRVGRESSTRITVNQGRQNTTVQNGRTESHFDRNSGRGSAQANDSRGSRSSR